MTKLVQAWVLMLLFVAAVSAKTVDLDVTFYTPDEGSGLLENPEGNEVRNIIFMIGDGMGITQVAMTRIYTVGPDGRLTMERLPVSGFSTTHSANKLITDSGASGTAMATGVKTKNKAIGVRPDGTPVPSILEIAEKAGLATGLVATSAITHATPASFAAHQKRRNDEDKIAIDMTESGVDVLLGGGREFFVGDDDPESLRDDGRNLFAELNGKGYDTVTTREEMLNSTSNKLVGLFEYHALTSEGDEPTLAEMTEKALSILSQDPDGFFVMIEGSQIDWAGHDGDPNGVVYHTLHFDMAIRKAIEFAQQDGHTLVVVTADHETGGLTIVDGDLDGSDLDVEFSTGHHTAMPVPLFAYGPGSTTFSGMMDNTDIPHKFARLLGLEGLEE